MNQPIKCPRCGREGSVEECYPSGDGFVCENCYMDSLSPAKACDPWAVKLAKGAGRESLKGIEKDFFELVGSRGAVSKEELPAALSATMAEVERAFSVLRHMELLKGRRRSDGGVDVVLFTEP